jgi:hypothetical protein
MVVLTEKQAKFIDYLNNNNNNISSAKMTGSGVNQFGITPDGSDIKLGVQNLTSSSTTEYYIYNVYSKMFMCASGFRRELGDKYTISFTSDSTYNIRNVTASKNVVGFRSRIQSDTVDIVMISAVHNETNNTSSIIDT